MYNAKAEWIGSYIITLCAALAFANLNANAGELKAGDSLPALASFELEGELPDYKGKVLLLDFFASWCGPCKASFPVMEELHRKYSEQGLVILAVSVDKNRRDMEAFLKKHPVTFATLRDPKGKLAAAAQITTMPSSVIIDRRGIVHAVHSGFHGGETKRQYEQQIDALLK